MRPMRHMHEAAVLHTHSAASQDIAVQPSSAGAYPLMLASPGQAVCVSAIRGKDETRRFLNDLGFVEGCEVSVVCEASGNIIVNAKGARVALSRQMAGRIMVQDA